MKDIKTKRIVYIFLISLCLRLILSVFIFNHPERAFDNDSYGYVQLADSLLDSHTFPSIFRTPVYPSFIAVIYSIFGKFPQAVLLFQYLLDSLTAIFVVLIFFRIFRNSKYSYVAGFIYAISPFAIFYSNMILTETLFTFLLAIVVYCFVTFLQNQQRRYLVLSSLLLGIATLCRPITLYLPILLMPFVFSMGYKFKAKLVSCMIFLMIFYIVLIPWYMKNYKEYDRLTLSTVSDLNIFMSFAPEVLMIKDNPLSVLQLSINKNIEHFQISIWDRIGGKYGWYDKHPFNVFKDSKRSAVLRKEGLKIIQENPLIFVIAHFIGIGRVLFPYYPPFYNLIGNDLKTISLLSFVIDFLIMGLFVLGVISSLKGGLGFKHNMTMVFMMVLIFYFSFIPGIVGYNRFKIPVLPYISIFATLGFWEIIKSYKLKRSFR